MGAAVHWAFLVPRVRLLTAFLTEWGARVGGQM